MPSTTANAGLGLRPCLSLWLCLELRSCLGLRPCLSLWLCLGLRPCLGTVSNKQLCRQTFKPCSSAAQTNPKGFKPSRKNRSLGRFFCFYLHICQKSRTFAAELQLHQKTHRNENIFEHLFSMDSQSVNRLFVLG